MYYQREFFPEFTKHCIENTMMRKQPYRHLIFIFLLLAVFVASAQSATDLHGTWELDIDDTIDLMNTAQRSDYDSLPSGIQGRIRTKMSTRSYQFNADSTFTTIIGSITGTGSWTLSGQQLTLNYTGGDVVTRIIQQINTTSMTLQIADSGSSAMFGIVSLNLISN